MTKPYYLMPDDENYISKTDIKKEVKELQEFATQLTKLGKSQRAKLTASDELQEAFLLADKISNKPDALRRHMQFMTKLLRDENLEALRSEYKLLTSPNQVSDKQMLTLETLRSNLIEQGNEALSTFVEQHPDVEVQKLRQLIRQAKKELDKEKPAKNYKELFQFLKQVITDEE
ncbi:MAG: DUF615 domain-containing protein [Gammaproteobacteria bacterium]|nr:DUF615 domain-containing protein [Gammaproteobacteria bacterium]